MKDFDIILVTWGRPERSAETIDSIQEHSRNYRLIWIDNDPISSSLIERRTSWGKDLDYFPFPENLGWLKGINAGIAISTAPYVVLMNDDVLVTDPGWLATLAQVKADRGAHIIGPATDAAQYQGRVGRGLGSIIVQPEIHYQDNYGIGNFPLSFFTIMITRECLVDVGYLDERFVPCHCDDDDWLLRAHRAGWKMAIQTDVLVRRRQGAYSEQDPSKVQAHRRANVEKLMAKWKKIWQDEAE
jgi:GT2 family glycosyltransferase